MNKKWLVMAAPAALVLGMLAWPVLAGDPEAGEALAESCAACHGADGNSNNPEWPKIAGQNERYLRDSLKAYRDGQRQDPLMMGEAANLSDEDIANLAAYYAAQDVQIGSADPELVELGEQIYRGGNTETGVSACMACHSPSGSGNAPAGYPAVSGQHAAYNAAALRAYANGERTGSMNAEMMQSIAERMSDEEIEAVSSYMEGLH